MKLLNDIMIVMFSNKVGEDEFGNMYYEQKRANSGYRKKRFVRYLGDVESTKIPPMWHAWLHYIEKKIPRKKRKKYAWQQPHLPNLTGTIHAFKPQGSLSELGRRKKSYADYEPWQPR